MRRLSPPLRGVTSALSGAAPAPLLTAPPPLLSSPRTVSVIGAPLAFGQRLDGPELAPAALRGGTALRNAITALGWRVSERGDVASPPAPSASSAVAEDAAAGGARHASVVGRANAALADAVAAAARAGHFALVLGGDHSIALGSIGGLRRARPRARVLWVDAHADINLPEGSPSGNMHGMPLAYLLRAVPLPPSLAWLADAPALEPADVVYIGLRDLDPGERRSIKRLGLRAFTMHDVDRHGIGGVMDAALAALAAGGGPPRPLHLSFDIDAVDPAAAPATGTPVPGGLSLREAHYIAEHAARSGRLCSMDMVEVNPALGGERGAADTLRLARDIIGSALGKDILEDGGGEDGSSLLRGGAPAAGPGGA